jgi:tape measure domain-containing protein
VADFSITGEVRLNSDPAEKSTSKWTVAAGQMIADFAKQASSKLAEVVKSGVDYNATMESYLTNFKVMLGSEEAAATKLSEIRKMAASTPFSLDDLTSGTQTLLQFGIAADDTTGVLQRLGDISLGNAEKLQTLTRAYGKMSSAQKVTLENVNMMIDAGFNPLNQICDATGESMSDLYKRISDGKVSFSELEAAVEAATSQGGQFYNGMLEASQTFNGRLSTLTDNTKALLGALSDSLYSSLSDLLPVANDVVLELTDAFTEGGVPAMLDTAAELLDNFADGLIQKIPDAVSAVSDLLTELLNYLADHQDDIFDTGVQLLENLIIGITDSLPNLITSAANLIARFAAALISHLPDILKCGAAMLTTLVDGIIRSIENLAEAALACIAKLVGVWDGNMDEFGHIGENIVQGIINGIAGVWGKLTSWVSGLIANLVGTASNAATTGIASGAASAVASAYNGKEMNHDQRHQDALAGKGISNKSWTERQNEAKAAAAESQKAAETISQSAGKAASAVSASGKKAASSAKKATAEVVKSISDTTTEIDGKITRTTENITETLSNGKTQQKQVITETSRQMVDGVLKDIKTITEVDEKGKKTVKQTMETVREVAKTVTATTSGIVDGIQTSTKTVTETLTDGTETQKKVITQTYDDVVDGALVTVERVKTIAADGTEEVAENIKEASIKSFDDLWKELQTHADTGLLGTFDDLYTAVKNKDWKSIGLWAANAIYGGLTAEQKKQVNDFAIGLVDKLNEALGNAQTALVQKGIDIGGQICKGLTSGFGEVWTQAKTLGTQLTGIFKGLKAPLSSAALAISQGLSGGLLSAFPAIYAGMGTMIGSVGAAFEGMLTAISAALNATVFGIPMGVIVAGAAVALGVAIAAICASLGASKKSPPSTGGGSASGGSGSGGISGDIDISTGTGSLEDAINANTKALEKTNAALADMIRQAGTLVLSDNMRLGSTVAASGTARVAAAANNYHREGDTNITQNIYSKAQTAADLQREARWEADRAKAQRR